MTGGSVPSAFGGAAWCDERVAFGKGVTIGHCSCIGAPAEYGDEDECRVGDGVRIGAFCTVTMGASLGSGVKLDHYCRVGASEVGDGTQLLYGARVHDGAKIGGKCIIGGNVPDRTIIGNDVMHFGRLAHIPNTVKNWAEDWDEAEDPSPRICDGAMIGAGALVVGDVYVGEGASIGAGALVVGDHICIKKEASIGAGASIIHNGITVGEGARLKPKCIVDRNVPPNSTVERGTGRRFAWQRKG